MMVLIITPPSLTIVIKQNRAVIHGPSRQLHVERQLALDRLGYSIGRHEPRRGAAPITIIQRDLHAIGILDRDVEEVFGPALVRAVRLVLLVLDHVHTAPAGCVGGKAWLGDASVGDSFDNSGADSSVAVGLGVEDAEVVAEITLFGWIVGCSVEESGDVGGVGGERLSRAGGVEGGISGEEVEEGFVAWVVTVIPVEDPGVWVVRAGLVAVAEAVALEGSVVVYPDDLFGREGGDDLFKFGIEC